MYELLHKEENRKGSVVKKNLHDNEQIYRSVSQMHNTVESNQLFNRSYKSLNIIQLMPSIPVIQFAGNEERFKHRIKLVSITEVEHAKMRLHAIKKFIVTNSKDAHIDKNHMEFVREEIISIIKRLNEKVELRILILDVIGYFNKFQDLHPELKIEKIPAEFLPDLIVGKEPQSIETSESEMLSGYAPYDLKAFTAEAVKKRIDYRLGIRGGDSGSKEEIMAFARYRNKKVRVFQKVDENIIELCGIYGDGGEPEDNIGLLRFDQGYSVVEAGQHIVDQRYNVNKLHQTVVGSNSLFHAFLYLSGIHIKPNSSRLDYEISIIRGRVAGELTDTEIDDNIIEQKHREAYRSNIKKMGFWGSLGEIRALARHRGKRIRLFRSMEEDKAELVGIYGDGDEAEENLGLMHMGNHYIMIQAQRIDGINRYNIMKRYNTNMDGNCLYHAFLLLNSGGEAIVPDRLLNRIQGLRFCISRNINQDELDYNLNELVDYDVYSAPKDEEKSLPVERLPELKETLKGSSSKIDVRGEKSELLSIFLIAKELINELKKVEKSGERRVFYRTMQIDEAINILDIFNTEKHKLLENFIQEMEEDMRKKYHTQEQNRMKVKNHLAVDKEQALSYLDRGYGDNPNSVTIAFTLKPDAHKHIFSSRFMAISDDVKSQYPDVTGKYEKASSSEGIGKGKIGLKAESDNKFGQKLSGYSLSVGKDNSSLQLLLQLFVEKVHVVDTNFNSVMTVDPMKKSEFKK